VMIAPFTFDVMLIILPHVAYPVLSMNVPDIGHIPLPIWDTTDAF